MSYEESWLWRHAFVERRDDASKDEQEWFRQRYLMMREKATHLVGRIASELKEMTVHDVTHLDALWEMASIVTERQLDLNPPEAFVFGGAVLLHDAAMTLGAYPNGLAELKQEVVWKDSYARLAARSIDNGGEPDEMTEKLATAEALRRLHADQAQKLTSLSWRGNVSAEEFLIDDLQVRRFYGPSIGTVANSHWWPISKIEDELSRDLGPLGGRTRNRIDLVKIACLLRVSDAIHLDQRRAPDFLRRLVQPAGISSDHWEFQSRLAVPFVQNGTLLYSASPSFDLSAANAWWLAYDAVEVVDRELKSVDRLLHRRGTSRLLASRVEGAASPTDLANYIPTAGWTPVDSTIQVSDVPKIIANLGGAKLYGNKPAAALRELIQNAADAVEARRKLESRDKDWGEIVVKIDNRDDQDWLIIEDSGTGMSQTVLTGPLIDFGNSLWRSDLASQEFPGLQAAGITATGRFGIGFFSVFMLGNDVRVTSRRYDKASDSALSLEFQKGLNSRPILYKAVGKGPIDGGTRIEVRLSNSPQAEDGLLYRSNWRKGIELRYLVAAIAPSLNVRLFVIKDDQKIKVVEPEDWLHLEESKLLGRLSSSDVVGHQDETETRLRPLVDSNGKIYGRAMVETQSYGNFERGCVSLGGLRAINADFFRGVIFGVESTAARDDAILATPLDILSEWATNQGLLVNQLNIDEEDKARAANVILLCGGEVGTLPLARLNGDWLCKNQIEDFISTTSQIKIFRDAHARFDENVDDVLAKDFRESFEDRTGIMFASDEFPGFNRQRSAALLPNKGAQNYPKNILEMIRSLIEIQWHTVIESEFEVEIGFVGSVGITRNVLQMERAMSGSA